MLAEIAPGGRDAARHLERLLDLKDAAHYGVIDVTPAELRRALRRSDQLVSYARAVVAG